MSVTDYELTEPPAGARARELWFQHAAGFVLFEDVRKYAQAEIDWNASSESRMVAEKAIDDTLYGLMMLIDGVTGGLRNPSFEVDVTMVVRLMRRNDRNETVIQEIDLRNGDGVCMGFHAWKSGDFGADPIAIKR